MKSPAKSKATPSKTEPPKIKKTLKVGKDEAQIISQPQVPDS